MDSAVIQVREAIRSAGIPPPDPVVFDNNIHRFPTNGKPSDDAGWYILFDSNVPGGSFGDWRTGFKTNWRADIGRPLTSQEKAAYRKRMESARRKREDEKFKRQKEAAIKARAIWKSARPTPGNHPYLVRKSIKANGAKLHKDALVLPVIDFTGKLTSLQFIDAEGLKRLLTGGRKCGCVIPIFYTQNAHNSKNPVRRGISAYCANIAYRGSKSSEPSRVIICEGWATGCTLAEDEPASLVLAAIDAGNLKPAALAARRRWPSAELVIAGDDDRLTPGNPGATKAKAAAVAAGALLALPNWPPAAPESLSDYNDLVVWLEGGAV
jgi:putative DNA primase/helicase